MNNVNQGSTLRTQGADAGRPGPCRQRSGSGNDTKPGQGDGCTYRTGGVEIMTTPQAGGRLNKS